MKSKRNAYTCKLCGETIITIDLVDGTTPFMLGCRATDECRGLMESHFYRVPQNFLPHYEWYKPTPEEQATLNPPTLEHVVKGGLLIRPHPPKKLARETK